MISKISSFLFLVILTSFSVVPADLVEKDLSWGEHEEAIRLMYPLNCYVELRSKFDDTFIVSLVEPKCVQHEKLVILTKNHETSTYKEEKSWAVQSDSAEMYGSIIKYKGLDGKIYVKRINEQFILDDVLPPHPTVESWSEIKFPPWGRDLLFAVHIEDYKYDTQYWTLRGGKWQFLFKGRYKQEKLFNSFEDIYRVFYNDEGLTIEFLNPSTLDFEPTNIKNIETAVTQGDDFIFSKKNPKIIIAVKNYHNGVKSFVFPDSNHAYQCSNILQRLRQKWRDESKSYADLDLSIRYLGLDSEDRIYELMFDSYQDLNFKGKAKLLNDQLFVEFDISFNEENFSVHPPLQLYSVTIGDDHKVPYYHIEPESKPNGKTLVLIEGGPTGFYSGGFENIIKLCSKNGDSIIITQENLRTGYGGRHFEKGLGEIGRGNLHQLIHIFYDAAAKGCIPDINQVSLYGSSYGGFVAVSFALRWDELHKESGLEKKFNFQAIIADAAWVNADLSCHQSQQYFVPKDHLEDVESYLHKVMPIHRAEAPLSAPLFLIHGMTDTRCSAADTRNFMTGLKAAGSIPTLFWHQGAHCSPEHKRYPEFLMALMNGAKTTELEAEIGLERC